MIKLTKKQAFTLVELLIVIAIIGILFVILVSRVDFASNKARTSGVQNDLKAFSNAAHMSAIEHLGFLSNRDELVESLNGYLDTELHLEVEASDLTSAAVDPWGNNYVVMQFKPVDTNGELVFISMGPDSQCFTNDDEVAMITYYNDGNIEITYPMEIPHNHVFEAYPSEQACKEKGNCLNPATYYYNCKGCRMKKYDTFTDGAVDPNNHVAITLGGTVNIHSKCLGCNTIVSSEHKFQESVQTEATCKNKGVSKYTCDCGYSYTNSNIPINPNNHSTEPTFVGTQDIHSQYMCCGLIAKDGSFHSYEASVLYAADCVFMGTTKYTCECGYYYTVKDIPIDPNNHFNAGYIRNGNKENVHKEYSCCGVVVEDGSYHVFDEGSVLFAADCIFMGTTKYTCECGYYYTEKNIPIDPNNHLGSGTIQKGGKENAHKEYSCCHAVVEDGSYHIFDEGSVLFAADCVFMGTTKYACECGYYYTEKNIPIDPDNHFGAGTIQEGGKENAHKEYSCCYAVVEDGSYHVFGEGTVTYQANCIFEGTTKYTCECGYYYTTKIPINPENHFSAGTIQKGGKENAHKEYSCCHAVVEDGSYHVFDKVTVTYQANCIFEGRTQYACACGYSYTKTDIPIDPDNHFSAGYIRNGNKENAQAYTSAQRSATAFSR